MLVDVYRNLALTISIAHSLATSRKVECLTHSHFPKVKVTLADVCWCLLWHKFMQFVPIICHLSTNLQPKFICELLWLAKKSCLKIGHHLDDDNDGHGLWLKAMPSLWRIKQWKDIDWQILVESSKNGIG